MAASVRSVTPYLCASDANAALTFYAQVFDAKELFRLTDPADKRIGHAEFQIGETTLFISDEYPDFGAISPDSLGGTPVGLHVQVADCDATAALAETHGALLLRKPADQSFGERVAQFQDPWGHRWFVAQNIEDVSPQEMQTRWEAETGI